MDDRENDRQIEPGEEDASDTERLRAEDGLESLVERFSFSPAAVEEAIRRLTARGRREHAPEPNVSAVKDAMSEYMGSLAHTGKVAWLTVADASEGDAFEYALSLGFEFDQGVDPARVEYQIRQFAGVIARLQATSGVPQEDAEDYLVLADGRWHPDVTQAFLMYTGQPYRSAYEWLGHVLGVRWPAYLAFPRRTGEGQASHAAVRA